MRVGFFGQSGPYAPWALRRLLTREVPFELAVVVEGRKQARGRVQHKRFGAQPGPLPPGEDLVLLGQSAGAEVISTCDVNDAALIRELQRYALDWIVCVGFDRLFSRLLLGVAGQGGINAHPSLLPSWRGPSPIFWALRAGERTLGVTLHALDPHEDHGPIYAQQAFPLGPRQSGEEIYHAAGEIVGALLERVLAAAGAGSIVGTAQDHTRATRAPRPRAEDAFIEPQQFRCEHLVDFACGAAYFRALWLRLGEDVFFVRRGLLAERGRSLPGQYALLGDRLLVACKDGLAHLEIQT